MATQERINVKGIILKVNACPLFIGQLRLMVMFINLYDKMKRRNCIGISINLVMKRYSFLNVRSTLFR